MSPMLQQFLAVALPIMITFVTAIWLAQWSQNKRLEEISKRIDEVIRRVERIEAKLDNFAGRIATLEERTSPLGPRR